MSTKQMRPQNAPSKAKNSGSVLLAVPRPSTPTLRSSSRQSQVGSQMAAPKPDVAPDTGARTFTFIDLAGFTAMTEAMSDEDAADVVARFCEIAREALG